MLENMLDYIRLALYATLLVLAFLLFQAWDKEHAKDTTIPAQTEAVTVPETTHFVPEMSNTNAPPVTQQPEKTAEVTAKAPSVSVKTDTLEATIDTRGGDITEVKLLHYPNALNSKTPILLLNDDPKTRYIAESGLLSKQGPDTSKGQALYTPEQLEYNLAPGTNEVDAKLTWQSPDGIKITKVFSFVRNSYEIKVSYDIENHSSNPWLGNLYAQLIRTDSPPPNHGGMVNLTTFFGAAFSTPQKPFEKISFKEMQESNLNQVIQGGWAAMIQHYFISAWVPQANTSSTYYTRVMPTGLYTIGLIGPALNVPAGGQLTTNAKLYTGPIIADKLEKTAPGLKLTIDYGWFWFISAILFWMLEKIYEVVGNWGWSIVLVTIIIKLLFYHLSAKSYRSMSALKKLQPRIELLKERYGDDKQKLTQATLELYREEKVNPMSGCLPILIQIPVFIALYWVLVESVQLRQAPFILWIHDLSQPDPWYVLPILMGISMFLQQRLSPPPPDPLQAKVMMLMPLIFVVLFANFPSGLMLYWFVNNTLSFLQQWYIMRQVEKEKK